MLDRILDHKVTEVAETSVIAEANCSKDCEDWVATTPEIPGEPLIIIGRLGHLDESKDRIGLLETVGRDQRHRRETRHTRYGSAR